MSLVSQVYNYRFNGFGREAVKTAEIYMGSSLVSPR